MKRRVRRTSAFVVSGSALVILLIVLSAIGLQRSQRVVARPEQQIPEVSDVAESPRPSPSPSVSPKPSPTTDSLRVCAAEEILAVASTSRPVYASGEVVEMTISLTNQSRRECSRAYSRTFRIVDAAGRWVAGVGVASMPSCMGTCHPPGSGMKPGITYRLDQAWDGKISMRDDPSDGQPVPPGVYRAEASASAEDDYLARAHYRAETTFEIR